jgi:hypothetical protein
MLRFIVVIALLTQMIVSPLVLQLKALEYKAQLGDDIELICTGAEMRFISVTKTQAAGKFVFVEPAQLKGDLPSIDLNELCPEHPYLDPDHLDLISTNTVPQLLAMHRHAVAVYLAQFSASTYFQPLLRGPPNVL